MSAKNTIQKSMEMSRTVRGYEIHRMPLGAFLEAVDAIRNAPVQILEAMYPGKGSVEALRNLSDLNTDALRSTLISAITYAPAQIVGVLSKLFGIPEETLLSDPQIGLDGLVELLNAWLDLNNIENFTNAVLPLVSRIRTAFDTSRRPTTGSNA